LDVKSPRTYRWIQAAVLCTGILFMTSGTRARGAATNSVAEDWLAHAEIAPPLNVPKSVSAWKRQRPKIRAELWNLLGKLPARPKIPRVQTLSREDRGTCIVEKFEFDNGAGSIVPGYLILPKVIKKKAPAILYCHWHGGEYDIGKEELFMAKHTPVPPGPELAAQGYVVLGVDAYCFGERNGKGPGGPAEKGNPGELTASKFNLWVGRTLWGMILRDDLMALDYLAARPEVDSTRIGVMGMSMGATRAWWLMALDERIKTGVPICCLTHYREILSNELLKAHGIYYYVPGMLNHFDTEAVIGLIAPRSVLFLDGDQDGTSPVDGIHEIERLVRQVYGLYGEEARFRSDVYAGQGHLYTPEMWQKTLEWLRNEL
jgi:cephalosporin-C deacetylase-like acetyl esterase